MTKIITLVKNDDTNFNEQVFLAISFKTNLDLTGYLAKLTIENTTNIYKKYEIQQNAFQVDFDKFITSTLEVGTHRANIKLYDTQNRIKTVYNFNINVEQEFNTSTPFINEYEFEVILDNEGISKYKNYNELKNKPQINNIILEGNKTLDEIGITQHIVDTSKNNIFEHNTSPTSHSDIREQIINKQDRLIAGENITIIDNIISSSNTGGSSGTTSNYEDLKNKPKINNVVLVDNISLEQIGAQPSGNYALISDIPTKTSELTNNSNLAYTSDIPTLLSQLQNDLGFQTLADVMGIIASIPQFKLSIVNELPTTGEKMTLYLVPKEAEEKDIYNEYIWIEQTSSFELIGTTAVDLTDYVKKTDYATSSKAGIMRPANGLFVSGTTGAIVIACASNAQIDAKIDKYYPIVPNNLNYAVNSVLPTMTQAEYDALATKDENIFYMIVEE